MVSWFEITVAELGLAAQVIRWVLFFEFIFIFQRAFAGYLFENAVKGALRIKSRFIRDAQQGNMVISGILHFPDRLLNAIFINEIIEAFFKHRVDDPG